MKTDPPPKLGEPNIPAGCVTAAIVWCGIFLLLAALAIIAATSAEGQEVSIQVWHDGIDITPDPCSYFVATTMEVELRAHWAHENPEGYYWKWRIIAIHNNMVLEPTAEGFPVAFEWWVRPWGILPSPGDWRLAKTCGEEAPPIIWPGIFDDGFESGTTGAWSREVP